MINFNDGGAAFPGTGNSGMSLRDYFAAKAMQGMLANDDWVKNMHRNTGLDADIVVSRAAYEVADAMIAARKEIK